MRRGGAIRLDGLSLVALVDPQDGRAEWAGRLSEFLDQNPDLPWGEEEERVLASAGRLELGGGAAAAFRLELLP